MSSIFPSGLVILEFPFLNGAQVHPTDSSLVVAKTIFFDTSGPSIDQSDNHLVTNVWSQITARTNVVFSII